MNGDALTVTINDSGSIRFQYERGMKEDQHKASESLLLAAMLEFTEQHGIEKLPSKIFQFYEELLLALHIRVSSTTESDKD